MVVDRGFLHVSEVGPVCNEIGFYADVGVGVCAIEDDHVFALVFDAFYGRQIIAEEPSERLCAEAAS